MKKAICILLTLCLLAALCACGKETEPTTPATQAKPVETAAPTDKPAETSDKPETQTPVETSTEEPTVPTTEAPAPVQAAEAPALEPFPAKWTLKELGPVDNSARDLYFYRDTMFRYEKGAEDETFLIATDHLGNPISEERYGNIDGLLPGMLAVTALKDDINSTGVILESGEVLIPCEAAIIKTISEEYNTDAASERYLYVIYGTEVTTNKDEAFFYATSAMISISPSEGDVLYKGYAMIFDTVEKRFVPNIKVTNASMSAVKTGGSLICCTNEDYSKSVYNSSGELLYQGSNVSLGNDFFLKDYNTVVDAAGNTLQESERNLNVLRGSGNYLNAGDYKSELISITDRSGGLLFEIGKDYSIYEEGGGYFLANKENTGYLIDAAGQEVASLENCYSPDYLGRGVWEFASKDSDTPSLYYLSNGTSFTAKRYMSSLVNEVPNETSGLYTFRYWNAPEQDVNIECSYYEKVADGLIFANGKPGSLIDCFSGETLLSADSVELVDGRYLYVRNGNEYTVYELSLES